MNKKLILGYIGYVIIGFSAAMTEHPLLVFTALPVAGFFLGIAVESEDAKQRVPVKQRKCCCQSPDEWCLVNQGEYEKISE